MGAFRPPVRRTRHGFTVKLGDHETQLVLRLLDELRGLLTSDDPAARTLTQRLFPPAITDDADAEAEYQRLMRDELVQSRLAALESVATVLDSERSHLDEHEINAFMRSLNSLRLVVGTMLDVTDDPDAAEVRADLADSPEHHLYSYLSWLLEHTVRALSTG